MTLLEAMQTPKVETYGVRNFNPRFVRAAHEVVSHEVRSDHTLSHEEVAALGRVHLTAAEVPLPQEAATEQAPGQLAA
jgi:hypothetical protein